jgi:hypothetical protein
LDNVTPSLNTARFTLGGAGTQTAALGFWWIYLLFFISFRILEWNFMDKYSFFKYSKKLFRWSRTSNCSFSFWWNTPGPAYTAATESWNGSSWTSVNSMNTARSEVTGAGTQTAAIAFGGINHPQQLQEQQNLGMELLV